MQQQEFEQEEFYDDDEVENSYLRRLYHTLVTPTKDLKPRKSKIFANDELTKNLLLNAADEVEGLFNKCIQMFGLTSTNIIGGKGFKSICNKTLWLKNSKYREVLMELAMMCQETSITTFVDNIDDL